MIIPIILLLFCGSSRVEGGKSLIKVYDYSISTSNPVAVLQNAFGIRYDKRLNEIWTAQFSLPADDSKKEECLAFRYVEIFDSRERVDLFRILPSKFNKNADSKIITYQCEHVLSTLLDDIMFQYNQTTGLIPAENIETILGYQSIARWQVGTVDFAEIYDYKWENENLLSALFSLPKAYSSEYQWTWNTEIYPWILNLIQPSMTATARIMSKKNLIDISEDNDPSYIVTRLYPLGYGEGINQLTIKDVNGGVAYIDASTIGIYGVISAPFIDKTEENAATLKAKAEAYLETIKIPRKSYNVNGADIYSISGDSLDRFRDPGIMVAVYDIDIVSFTARIVSVSKSDLTGNPGDIMVQISNKILDSADTTTSLQNRQHINDVYAQGATNIDSNDYQDNCDNTHPATIKFYVPSECVAVNKCLLTYETSNFRAYEQATKGGGADTVTSDSRLTGVTSTENVWSWDVSVDPVATTGSSYTGLSATAYREKASTPEEASDFENHNHDISDITHNHKLRGHIHTINLNNFTHQHETELPDHVHDIDYGIYEFGYLPTTVVIKVDGSTIPITELTGNDIDIVPYLSLTGGKVSRGAWHMVEIYPGITGNNPTGLARITAAIVKQIFVQSRGGGNY